VGVSITDFLCGQLGIDPEYVENRIQTIFLNNKPVDDESAAILSDGDTLALSASMPGTLGATMRKGGFFSPLRYQISHTADGNAPAVAEGCITLKLFNAILKELGGPILSRGVIVEGGPLKELLARQGGAFWDGVTQLSLNGDIVSRKRLSHVGWPDRTVRLKVDVPTSSNFKK
jgi:hypothetical protein